jgi:hypothetical protein
MQHRERQQTLLVSGFWLPAFAGMTEQGAKDAADFIPPPCGSSGDASGGVGGGGRRITPSRLKPSVFAALPIEGRDEDGTRVRMT